ncbi:MAG: hypothetical protein ACK4PN_12920 [Allorhizobium sp.]
MTTVGYDSRIPSQSRRLPTVVHPIAAAPLAASLAASLAALVAASRALQSWRRRRADARALEALPFDLRKDIGWPASDRHL